MLEREEELELPAEVIMVIQTSLQLLGNASAQNTIDQRKAILTQTNSQLKSLVRDYDFKEAAQRQLLLHKQRRDWRLHQHSRRP